MLHELNPTVIEDYYIYPTTVIDQCNNTAVKTMKTLRTVILHGIKMGVLHNDPYLGVQFHMNFNVGKRLQTVASNRLIIS